MVQIYLDNTLLFDGSQPSADIVIDPSITNELFQGGSFHFILLPNHSLYDEVKELKSKIRVYRDSTLLFDGRVLDTSCDFYKRKTVNCEGALTYLADSQQPPLKDKTETVQAFFTRCINNHNAQVENDKKFTIGNITVPAKTTSAVFAVSGYTQTDSVISDLLIAQYRGFLRVRYENDTHYIDYLENYGRTNNQELKRSENRLDSTQDSSGADIYTVLIPTGDDDITIASVNSNSIYLEDAAGIEKYGRIVKTQSFPGIKTASELKTKAQQFFNRRSEKDKSLSISMTAVDMHYLNPDIDEILLGDVFPNIEGTDESFTCVSVSYNLFNAERDSYTFENEIGVLKRAGNGTGNGSLTSRLSSKRGGGGGGGGSGTGIAAVDELEKNFKKTYDTFELYVNKEFTLQTERLTVVAGDVASLDGDMQEIKGSGLFANKDALVQFCGVAEVKNGNLVIKDGSGLRMNRNGTEYGVYDSGSLTAGIIVSKVNGGTVKIQASKVDLGEYAKVESLEAEKARLNSLMAGNTLATKITATTGIFSNASLGSSHGGGVSIYGQTVRIYSVVDTNGTTRNVFGYS